MKNKNEKSAEIFLNKHCTWTIIIIIAAMFILINSPGYGNDEKSTKPVSPTVEISLAYQDRVVDAPILIAIYKKIFEQEGIKVKAMRFNNGPACSEALLLGKVDFATMGDTTAVIAAAREAPISIIASHGGGENRHRIIVNKNSTIKDIADLKGKRIAVKKGTSTYGGFLLLAGKNHLNLSNAEIIDMEPGDMPDAICSGSIDAIVASEPTPSLVESFCGGCELATLAGLGNNYPVFLVARRSFAQSHPDVVIGVLKVIREGSRYINKNKEETAEIFSKVTGLPIEITKKSMSYHNYHVSLDETTMESLKAIAGFLIAQGIIDKIPDFEKVVEKKYLQHSK